MSEISFAVLGVILGCSAGLAGIYVGVSRSKVRPFGRLSKPAYLGISSGLMLGVVLPATMHSVLFPQAAWLPTLRWMGLLALALIGLLPIFFRWRSEKSPVDIDS